MKKMMRYRKIPNTPTTPISKISLFWLGKRLNVNIFCY
jgi:hypothetical protein